MGRVIIGSITILNMKHYSRRMSVKYDAPIFISVKNYIKYTNYIIKLK